MRYVTEAGVASPLGFQKTEGSEKGPSHDEKVITPKESPTKEREKGKHVAHGWMHCSCLPDAFRSPMVTPADGHDQIRYHIANYQKKGHATVTNLQEPQKARRGRVSAGASQSLVAVFGTH